MKTSNEGDLKLVILLVFQVPAIVQAKKMSNLMTSKFDGYFMKFCQENWLPNTWKILVNAKRNTSILMVMS